MDVSGWTGYYCGEYGSAVAAIRAGQQHWEKLRNLGTGGSEVDPLSRKARTIMDKVDRHCAIALPKGIRMWYTRNGSS